jgi:hypothetical protein
MKISIERNYRDQLFEPCGTEMGDKFFLKVLTLLHAQAKVELRTLIKSFVSFHLNLLKFFNQF